MHCCCRFLSLFVVIPLLAAVLASCAKDGATGPTGPSGSNGNANVITRVITVYDSTYTSGAWTFSSAIGVNTYRFCKVRNITDSAITKGVVDSGMVLVYVRAFFGDSAWTPLPFKYLAIGDAFYYNIVFSYKESTLKIFVYLDANYSGASVPDIATLTLPPYKFKYLIVTGTSLTQMKKAGVNMGNMQEVKDFLGRQLQLRR